MSQLDPSLGPGLLYLHGFASSPESYKGRAFARHFGEERLRRLDLRLPNRDHLRVSAMIDHVRAETRVAEEVILIGSSLGGLVAAHVAALEPAVRAAIVMAPAFGFVRRWGERLGAEAMARWRGGEALEVEDHAGGPPLQVDFGFYEDAALVDAAFPHLEVPVLIFHGRQDEVVDIAGSVAFAEQTSHADLVKLEDDHGLVKSLPRILERSTNFIQTLRRDHEPQRNPQ
ncbi:MAG: YqiA/YcfP family alpha/beta fold hydrolase [Polyangiaceae bacterium]